jgi:hypothetical protein
MSSGYKYAFYFSLVIVLILAIVCRNFLNYYVDPYDYKTVLYSDLSLQTGDLMLERTYSSPQVWITGTKFSHVGVIVVINSVPYIIEGAYPGVWLTKFSERIQGANGSRFYVKQRTRQLSVDKLNYVTHVIERAKQFRYANDITACFLKNRLTTVENMCKYIDTHKECICDMFCIWFLRNIGALQFERNKIDCYDLNWLSKMEGYSEIRRMTLFAGCVLMPLHYYPKLLLEAINPFSRPTASDSVLLLASKE